MMRGSGRAKGPQPTEEPVTTSTAPKTFQKATLQNAEERRDPMTGLLFNPERSTEIVGSEAYERHVAEGWTVVETWNVWTCAFCGMNDSDREHAAWEAEHFGPITHLDRYGHVSVRPEQPAPIDNYARSAALGMLDSLDYYGNRNPAAASPGGPATPAWYSNRLGKVLNARGDQLPGTSADWWGFRWQAYARHLLRAEQQ